jgi:hypothetical protein
MSDIVVPSTVIRLQLRKLYWAGIDCQLPGWKKGHVKRLQAQISPTLWDQCFRLAHRITLPASAATVFQPDRAATRKTGVPQIHQ